MSGSYMKYCKLFDWKFFIIYLSVFAFISFEFYVHIIEDKECQNEPVDVVYTWVNGSDPRFIVELQSFLNLNDYHTSNLNQRYDDKAELKFSLRSLEKYAPWVNHVYIITNGQIPCWLDLDYEKISVITHAQIFPNPADLPTFSSPAIEAHIHRIPGLSKKFIYLNDDIFFGDYVYLDDFFTINKGFRIYLAWPLPPCADNCVDGYDVDELTNGIRIPPKIAANAIDNVGDKMSTIKLKLVNIEEQTKHYSNDKTKKLLEEQKNVSISPTEFADKASTNQKLDNLIHRNAQLMQTLYLDGNEDSKKLAKAVYEYNAKILRNNKIKRSIYNKKTKELIVSQKRFLNSEFMKKIRRSRKRVDKYGDSLQYSNRLFNTKYGFLTRMVPSHAPLLIDKDVMAELQAKFENEFEETSRNKFRSSNDLQYSFVYYYFIIQEKIYRTIGDIFDIFDMDSSGTWSDREIRTLLSRLYELPLNYATVDYFEAILMNCSNREYNGGPTTPEFERYMDSQLGTISKELISNCFELSNLLVSSLGKTVKYKHEIVKNSEIQYVSFKMLSSNISDVVSHLDEIRSSPRKFICLNDNLDESMPVENALIKTVLYDFYLALFPLPSKFELGSEVRNRFTYMNDLEEWRSYHFKLKIIVYVSIAAILYFIRANRLLKKLCKLTSKMIV